MPPEQPGEKWGCFLNGPAFLVLLHMGQIEDCIMVEKEKLNVYLSSKWSACPR